MKKIANYSLVFLLVVGMIVSFVRCSDDVSIDPTTSTVKNMYSYVKENTSPTYATFASIIEKAGYNVFLDAYGTYTMLLPTDAAVKAYLTANGKNSVDDLTKVEAQNIVKVHLLSDTLSLSTFTDGRLQVPTMYGIYLQAGAAVSASGEASYTINKTSNIVSSDVRVGNGIIQVIDKVIEPTTKTLAKLIEANANYSIFTQALKETGYYDSLSTTGSLVTVIAEPNAVLAKAGFTSYAQLKARYSKTGNPKLKSDSLNLYVAFHILQDAKYLGDLVTASSHLTKVSTEITQISASLRQDSLLVNDIFFNGKRMVGSSLNRVNSDVLGVNGILHESEKHFTLKQLPATRIDWDICDIPELKRLTSVYRKKEYNFIPDTNAYSGVKWFRPATVFTYRYNTTTGGSTGSANIQLCKDKDALEIPLGNLATSARNQWARFTTPVIPKGRYKVWINYVYAIKSSSQSYCSVEYYLDNSFVGIVDHLRTAPAGAGSAAELELLNWKYYMYQAPVAPATFAGNNKYSGKMIGFVDVNYTGSHTFYMNALNDGSQNILIDMIQFIPASENQTSPRFNIDGTLAY